MLLFQQCEVIADVLGPITLITHWTRPMYVGAGMAACRAFRPTAENVLKNNPSPTQNEPMIQEMRRLSPRSAANGGICVDADGAMLGSEWPLVRRTPRGFAALARDAAANLQKCALGGGSGRDPDWLFRQSQRIAAALDRGEVALAQIYGLYIPIADPEGLPFQRLADVAPYRKAGFNPDEPRIPAGQRGAGEWTTGGDVAAAPPVPASSHNDKPPLPLIGGRWPAPAITHFDPLYRPAAAEDDDNGRGGLLGDFMELPREFRQAIYESLCAKLRDLEPGNQALQTLTSPSYSPSQADIDSLAEALREAQERAGEPPATAWELGWGARGVELERQRLAGQRTLPFNTPTIDDFSHGVALSIKSIDLNAPWYGNPLNLSRRIDGYVNQLIDFSGLRWSGETIEEDQITGKVLDIIVPKESGTEEQREAIAASIERARRMGIFVFVAPY